MPTVKKGTIKVWLKSDKNVFLGLRTVWDSSCWGIKTRVSYPVFFRILHGLWGNYKKSDRDR